MRSSRGNRWLPSTIATDNVPYCAPPLSLEPPVGAPANHRRISSRIASTLCATSGPIRRCRASSSRSRIRRLTTISGRLSSAASVGQTLADAMTYVKAAEAIRTFVLYTSVYHLNTTPGYQAPSTFANTSGSLSDSVDFPFVLANRKFAHDGFGLAQNSVKKVQVACGVEHGLRNQSVWIRANI